MGLKKLQQIIFYLLVFLIPSNLAKHWPQDWSYVHGILIDYLIPTIYLTDLLILTLLGLWLLEKLVNREYYVLHSVMHRKKKSLRPTLYWLLTITCLLLNILLAKNRPVAVYKWIKVLEFGLLIYYISSKGRSRSAGKNKTFIKVLSLSVIWQSVLAIGQWLKQGSIFGYWFLGEQPFNTSTLAIKKISLLGQIKVLPMGTFPHSNVLAGFLVISLLLILLQFNGDRRSIVVISALILGMATLGLTFSFPAWIGFIGGMAYYVGSRKYCVLRSVLRRKNKSLRPTYYWLLTTGYLLLAIILLGVIWGLGGIGKMEASSFSRRMELNKIAWKMWQSSPIFGVGLNNFVPRMEEFGQVVANYRFLQPVHNIFLLVLSEMGIVGLMGFGWLILKLVSREYCVLRRAEKPLHPTYYWLLTIVILLLGSFDHYWLTIQQGMLVLSTVLALSLLPPRQRKQETKIGI